MLIDAGIASAALRARVSMHAQGQYRDATHSNGKVDEIGEGLTSRIFIVASSLVELDPVLDSDVESSLCVANSFKQGVVCVQRRSVAGV